MSDGLPFTMSLNHRTYMLTPRCFHSRMGVCHGQVILDNKVSVTSVTTHSWVVVLLWIKWHTFLWHFCSRTVAIQSSLVSLSISVDGPGSWLTFHFPLSIALCSCPKVVYVTLSMWWKYKPGAHCVFKPHHPDHSRTKVKVTGVTTNGGDIWSWGIAVEDLHGNG